MPPLCSATAASCSDTQVRRKRPLRYIEEEAVECALWPHLYWDKRLCETTARLADARRVLRRQEAEAAEMEGDEKFDPDAGEEAARRQSLKRSFLAKAMGPIADYAGDYELLHFVFDLSNSSDVGGKKGALRGTPMWQAFLSGPCRATNGCSNRWRNWVASACNWQAPRHCTLPVSSQSCFVSGSAVAA